MNHDQAYPAWIREIQTLLPVCSHFVLTGNTHDSYLGPPTDEDPDLRPFTRLRDLVERALYERGLRVVLSYEATSGVDLTTLAEMRREEAERLLRRPLNEIGRAGDLASLSELIRSVAASKSPVGLVVESASRLVRDHQRLSEIEFTFFREVDRCCRTASPRHTVNGRSLNSAVIWVVDSERDLPAWFALRNEMLRIISVPFPDSGDREKVSRRHLLTFGEPDTPKALDRSARILTEQTAGMSLNAIRSIVRVAEDQGISRVNIDDAARSYRVGITENPWRADFIAERLRREMRGGLCPDDDNGRPLLTQQVLGQDDAVAKAVDILARSAAGLTAAHAGLSVTRPRGVLFFAGPTGVGKTQLAQALTWLLFGDERFYVRFDMSEFSAEHSAARLIGAPPGYVGYDAGGELTNAIRERPFSVVLFDEIDKAHERILDKFLQVLDDGRLTDGRGQTVYFTESVIIFTSNLGIYREVKEVIGGVASIRRELAIDKTTHPTRQDRAEAVRQAIRDHFTLTLGRPELLNRIGDDNIVVFDFIDDSTADQILAGMIDRVMVRVKREHDLDVVLTDASRSLIRAACMSEKVLAMGGRGIGSKLETVLINPLSRLLITAPHSGGNRVGMTIYNDHENWIAQWS